MSRVHDRSRQSVTPLRISLPASTLGWVSAYDKQHSEECTIKATAASLLENGRAGLETVAQKRPASPFKRPAPALPSRHKRLRTLHFTLQSTVQQADRMPRSAFSSVALLFAACSLAFLMFAGTTEAQTTWPLESGNCKCYTTGRACELPSPHMCYRRFCISAFLLSERLSGRRLVLCRCCQALPRQHLPQRQ